MFVVRISPQWKICDIYDDKTLSVSQYQRWFAKFRSRDFSLKSLPRPSAEKVLDNDVLRALIKSDNTQTVEQLAEQFSCSESIVDNHLKEIGMYYKVGKCVPHQLTKKQKNIRMTSCYSLLNRHHLKQTVTGVEKWILYENSKRWCQWVM